MTSCECATADLRRLTSLALPQRGQPRAADLCARGLLCADALARVVGAAQAPPVVHLQTHGVHFSTSELATRQATVHGVYQARLTVFKLGMFVVGQAATVQRQALHPV